MKIFSSVPKILLSKGRAELSTSTKAQFAIT